MALETHREHTAPSGTPLRATLRRTIPEDHQHRKVGKPVVAGATIPVAKAKGTGAELPNRGETIPAAVPATIASDPDGILTSR